MRIVYHNAEISAAEFARKAAEYFKENPRCYTYADRDPTPGEFFAIRWNPYTVLVVRLDEDWDPACYPLAQWKMDDLPPLKPS
jgi:hypothetical protein